MTNNLPPDTGTQPQYAADTKLTLTEVAEVTGRDIKTIKVWNDKGKGRWPDAVQDTTGRKAPRVPVTPASRPIGAPRRGSRTPSAPSTPPTGGWPPAAPRSPWRSPQGLEPHQ